MSSRHAPVGCSRSLTIWYELRTKIGYRMLTEIVMASPPLSQHRIKGKAEAVLGLTADVSGVTAIEYTLIVVLVVMGFNLLGDGLRDVLDPRLRRDVSAR